MLHAVADSYGEMAKDESDPVSPAILKGHHAASNFAKRADPFGPW